MRRRPPTHPAGCGPAVRRRRSPPWAAATDRPDWRWPDGSRLAVYLGFNLEHFAFAFGAGLGSCLGPPSPPPDVLNHGWREYGNRVGAWRCLELFDRLGLPAAAILNTSLYDHCPDLVAACVQRGDELVGHGHTNAERQGAFDEAVERELLLRCREHMRDRSGAAPRGWLSPWISESWHTPDLLAETGYDYTLNWCHDDQPVRMRTRDGRGLWAVPYPQELNDIPMIVARQMDAKDFAQMIIDHFDTVYREGNENGRVMCIALHPYMMGAPHRLKHLDAALAYIRKHKDAWICTAEEILDWYVANGLKAYQEHLGKEA